MISSNPDTCATVTSAGSRTSERPFSIAQPTVYVNMNKPTDTTPLRLTQLAHGGG
jgi:hypothetical protein